MTESLKCVLSAASPADTERIAEYIGGRLKGGEIIELVSDLGGGKTTFTRGLARAAGSKHVVASPTFTISKVYSAPDFDIHHFDFYRLADSGLAAYELHDLINDPHIVIVVEWGGVVSEVLPEERITIQLTRTGEDSREISVTCPASLQYLVEGLC